ncbi:hypothetical protein pkur_cds_820 [Pandoravirus kuranda]|uniref:Uncharacterized protein n=2 Tax=Pandoravirus TaxID=2060084 RepID=A0AA95EJD9_9VIRU|nr:hypothetical protein pneo_cds_929 [Pandoravirus neocaledonia]AVK76536.1 hypothetical protein pneo_cds_929 [Pandoravirus neocaledonia]WBR14994.1 hypothetical protein pkur_cds_820 [Pandoravirus kuranda]
MATPPTQMSTDQATETSNVATVVRTDSGASRSWASRISRTYCRHQSVFWLALLLTVVFLVVATGMTVRYRCWQWRSDPVASAVMERRKRRLPTPYSYFATV